MYHSSIVNENNILKSRYAVLYNHYTQLHKMYLTLYDEKVAQVAKNQIIRDPIQPITVITPEEIISALQSKIAELSEIITIIFKEHVCLSRTQI